MRSSRVVKKGVMEIMFTRQGKVRCIASRLVLKTEGEKQATMQRFDQISVFLRDRAHCSSSLLIIDM